MHRTHLAAMTVLLLVALTSPAWAGGISATPIVVTSTCDTLIIDNPDNLLAWVQIGDAVIDIYESERFVSTLPEFWAVWDEHSNLIANGVFSQCQTTTTNPETTTTPPNNSTVPNDSTTTSQSETTTTTESPSTTTTTDRQTTTTEAAPPTTQGTCHEDEPCWNCETMGNRYCGTTLPYTGPVSSSALLFTTGLILIVVGYTLSFRYRKD